MDSSKDLFASSKRNSLHISLHIVSEFRSFLSVVLTQPKDNEEAQKNSYSISSYGVFDL